MLPFEYFAAAGAAVAGSGTFIPVAALPGMTAAELAETEPTETKESKSVLAMLNALTEYLSANEDVVGLSAVKNLADSDDNDLLTLNYSASWLKLVNLETNAIQGIPASTRLSAVYVFPGMSVFNGGNVPGAGVLIPASATAPYGSPDNPNDDPGEPSVDDGWFAALLEVFASAEVRNTATATKSAIVTASRGLMGAQAFPAEFTQIIDEQPPTTVLDPAELPQRGLITRSFAYAIQVQLNQATQTFDVYVV